MDRILIKGGTVIDGTGQDRYQADLLVEGDRIKAIGTLESQDFDYVINADGMAVSPGFIDTHSHSDLKVLVDPLLEPKLRQGITTEVLGQDGISMAPLPLEYVGTWRKNLAGLEGSSDELSWDWQTTAGYLQKLEEAAPGINESYLVPHGNIRMEAMGLDIRTPNTEEMEKMKAVLRRELEAGAWGMSTGLIYIPCAYAKKPELIELCKVVAEYDGVFVIHQRSEADTILESMQEVLDIGRASGVKIHFSHMKICGKKNRDKFEPVLAYLDQAKAEGIRVSFDQYPYVAGSTMLGVILPPWAHAGGTDKLLARLGDSEMRRKMVYDIEHGLPGWDNFIDFAGLDQIYITSVNTKRNEDLVGKSLTEIGAIRGKNPYDAAFDLIMEEENAVGMVDFYGLEDHVTGLMLRPEQNVCTDGLLGGKPHPRVYGSFPKVLGRYVRSENIMKLEDAIRKMTGKPAEVFGFDRRGLLKAGYYADLVIFDPNTVIDNGDYVDPARFPTGIHYVLVNGRIVLDNGRHTQARAGKVLRKKA
jgi:N-acyl-D-amino-acid deacylase